MYLPLTTGAARTTGAILGCTTTFREVEEVRRALTTLVGAGATFREVEEVRRRELTASVGAGATVGPGLAK